MPKIIVLLCDRVDGFVIASTSIPLTNVKFICLLRNKNATKMLEQCDLINVPVAIIQFSADFSDVPMCYATVDPTLWWKIFAVPVSSLKQALKR